MNLEGPELRNQLNRETSQLAWTELLRQFAAGNVVAVSDDLDLVEVAVCFANDDKPTVAQWLAENRVARVSDSQAQDWLEAQAVLWAVVVRPWVLVQKNKGCAAQSA